MNKKPDKRIGDAAKPIPDQASDFRGDKSEVIGEAHPAPRREPNPSGGKRREFGRDG
jgi:hypothetical protein